MDEEFLRSFLTGVNVDPTSLLGSFLRETQQGLVGHQSSEVTGNLMRQLNLVKTLLDLTTLSDTNNEREQEILQSQQLKLVVTDVCLPALRLVRPGDALRGKSTQMLHTVCRIMSRVCLLLPETRQQLYRLCVQSLDLYSEEMRLLGHGKDSVSPTALNVHCALEIADYMLDGSAGNVFHEDEAIFQSVVAMLPHSDYSTCSKAAGVTIPRFLGNSSTHYSVGHRLKLIWDHLSPPQLGYHRNQLLVLFSVFDFFFAHAGESGLPDVRTEPRFWEMLQAGMIEPNNLSRKFAINLLKKVVDSTQRAGTDLDLGVGQRGDQLKFWWKKSEEEKLMSVWQDYIYLVEALEETQMHMVMEMSPRLNSLISAAMVTNDGHPYLHTSWILLILQNAFAHNNRFTVCKWALVKFLSLDFSRFPLLQQGGQQFIYGLVLETLNEPGLFSRQPDSPAGSCPPLGEAVVQFFTSLLTAIDKDTAVSFLQGLLAALQKARGWNPLSLFFVFYGLSSAPSFEAWNPSSLLIIREMVSTWTATFKPIFRGAIQYYALETLLKFLDCSSVSVYQLSLALTAFKSGESLTRKSVLWNKLCAWLKSNSSKFTTGDAGLVDVLNQDISKFFADLQKKGETNEMIDDRSVQRLAKIMLLVADSHFTSEEKSEEFPVESSHRETPLNVLLPPVADTLRKLNTNLYMPLVQADASLQLLRELLNEVNMGTNCSDTNSDQTVAGIASLFDTYSEEIWAYIQRKLTGHLTRISDVPRLNLYIAILSQLTQFLYQTISENSRPGNVARMLMKNRALELAKACTTYYKTKQGNSSEVESVSKLCVVRFLSWIGQYAVIDTSIDGGRLREMVKGAEISFSFQRPKEIVVQKDWGKLAALFYASRWNIVHCLQTIEGGQSNDAAQSEELLTKCVESMPLASIEAINEIFKCTKVLIPLVFELNAELCLQAIDLGYQTMRDLDHGTLEFWDMLGLYIELSYQKYLLLKEPGSIAHDKLQQIFQKLYSFGERKSGVVNVVVSQCLRVWSDTTVDVAQRMLSATYHLNIIAEACLYGHSSLKDQRTQMDVAAFIHQLGGQFSTNQASDSVFRESSEVRVNVVWFLCSLVNDGHSEVRSFLHQLAEELLQRDQEINQYKKSYFKDSHIHRVKQRVWQILLILHSTFTKELSEAVLNWTIESLVDVNQMSVRLMNEWMAILLLHKFPGLQHHLWTLLEQGPDKRIGCISSSLSIIPHLGSLCDSSHQMEAFFDRSIPRVAVWLMAQNFSVKLYAQAALTKIWQVCTQRQLQGLLQAHSVIGGCLQFSQHSKHALRLGDKLSHDFFFFHFHPIQDFSIETLFHTLPWLCNVYEEELIDPAKFDAPNIPWDTLPLYNSRDDLKRCQPGSWKLRTLDASKAKNGHSQLNPLDFGDVQRKITPCSTSEVMEENVVSSQHAVSTRQGSLVLVASLVEKSPNLGGLCRTSEIFGVSTLVLNSVQCTESKEFQSLSVTAEKWVNLQEVKVEELKDYLLGMRKDGYLLVGIEQTANSQNLTDYNFTEKTVLLLGNEKKGIPAALIPLLDTCVEIPQLGVVRSLNVHVSGAICVWEYTRQNLLTPRE